MALGKVINAAQWLWSKDGESTYSHAGIIIDPEGITFEALWTICKGHLDAYLGDRVIIARCEAVSGPKKEGVLKALIVKHQGQWYPFWRLPMHLIPFLAKISVTKRPVCSELVAKYLYKLGVRHPQWAGTNPDTLADEWRRWRDFNIIYEGIWNGLESDVDTNGDTISVSPGDPT